MTSSIPQERRVEYPDLASALRLNEPSDFKHKLQSDSASSCDPILDHLMGSYAFQIVVWFFFAALMGIGLTVVGMNMTYAGMGAYADYRTGILLIPGTPVMVCVVPGITMFVLPFSRRLK